MVCCVASSRSRVLYLRVYTLLHSYYTLLHNYYTLLHNYYTLLHSYYTLLHNYYTLLHSYYTLLHSYYTATTHFYTATTHFYTATTHFYTATTHSYLNHFTKTANLPSIHYDMLAHLCKGVILVLMKLRNYPHTTYLNINKPDSQPSFEEGVLILISL